MATTKLGQLMWKFAIVCILATVSSQLMIINEVNAEVYPPIIPDTFPTRRQGDPECWIEQGSKYTICDWKVNERINCSNNAQCGLTIGPDNARVKKWLNQVNDWNKCIRDNRMSNQAFIQQMILEDWVYMKLVLDLKIPFTREDGMPNMKKRSGESPRDTSWLDNLRSNTNFRPSNLGSRRGGSSPRRQIVDASTFNQIVADVPKPNDFYAGRKRRISEREQLSKDEIAECMKIKSKHEQIYQDEIAEIKRRFPSRRRTNRRAQLPVHDHNSSSSSLHHESRTGRRRGRGGSARQTPPVSYPRDRTYPNVPICKVNYGIVECEWSVISNCEGLNSTYCSYVTERDEYWANYLNNRQLSVYLNWDDNNDKLWFFNATYQLVTKARLRRLAFLDPNYADFYLTNENCKSVSKFYYVCREFYVLRTQEYKMSDDQYNEEWPKVLDRLAENDIKFRNEMEQIDVRYFGKVRGHPPITWPSYRQLPTINIQQDYTKPNAKVHVGEFPFDA